MRFVARALAVLGIVSAMALPALGEPVRTSHLTAELVAAQDGIRPGGSLQVALRQDIQKGWHTYWKNSGDSGAPTELTWTLPQGWTAGDLVWAAPSRQPTGPLMNYGYQGAVLLPLTLTAPKSVKTGQTVTLKAHAAFLVCADVCVPEDADLTLAVKVLATEPTADPAWADKIAAALAAAPKTDELTGAFERKPGQIRLAVTGPALKGVDLSEAYFFPNAGDVIDHAKPQAIERGPEGLTLTLVGSPLPGTSPTGRLAGVLEVAGKAYELDLPLGPLPAKASGLGPPPAKAGPAATPGADLGLIAAIGFAIIGGLILNLMPCVFPILAMKAASLAAHAHERKEAQAQGLAFLAGCLATFLGLAGLLIAVRAGGAAVGWGFQLQSPIVVASLAMLMLAVALNLSGLFEMGSSLQGLGTQAAGQGGMAGAFLTGALAVIVAAPCTAPFMAPALGWALVQPPLVALAVFAGLGLGFAAPFTLAAFAPGLLTRLPRPGPWMDGFRKLMAFPMYGTAAWLAWVLAVQSGSDALAKLFAGAVLLAMAAWVLGMAQSRHAAGKSGLTLAVTGAGLLALAVGFAVWPGSAASQAGNAAPGTESGGLIPHEAYSAERLAAAQAAGKPVFVNFTAAWCVTCQVNEKVAFSTRQAAEAFSRTGTVYLKADWTRRDGDIAAELAKYGRAGVPLYLVYPAKGGAPVILPQLLTPDIVAQSLTSAAGH